MSSPPRRPAPRPSRDAGGDARGASEPEGAGDAALEPTGPAGGAGPRAAAACHPRSGCITCSDEGVPVRVLETRAGQALAICVDDAGSRCEVMTELVGPVSPGDRLLVHAGTALLALDLETRAGETS